jgi:DNA polymerase-1
MARGRLFLIDASGYVYRAFHALPALNTSRGLPTNATLGFANMVAKLLRGGGERDYLAVVFDAPGGTFRDAIYADYKQNRPSMPDDLRPQLPYIRKLVTALQLPVIEERGVEADDVIGTLAARAEAEGLETVIVTADKDMMQLVTERTTLYDDVRNRRVGIPEVRERFGVDPAYVPDVLGLMGDPIDNIPGVTGIGQKTASALVQGIGPVDAILARLDEVERCGVRGAKKIRETLIAEGDVARVSKDLATIRRDVPVTVEWEQLRWHGPDVPALRPLLMELEFMALLRELAPTGPTASVEVERREAASASEVAAVVAALAKEPAVSVFAVLDSPRATSAGLTAILLGGPSGPPVVLATPESPETLAAIAPLLGDFAVTKLGNDLKALRVALARRRIGLAGPAMDFGLASYCLNPSQPVHDAATLAHLFLGEPAVAGGDPVDAACRAARVAHALRPVVEERLALVEMQKLYRELEMPLAEVLADMELAGVALDTTALATMSAELSGALERIIVEVYALAGGEFNIGSPVQLRDVLFDRLKLSTKGVKKTKTGLSTDVDVLTKLAAEHPLPAKILEYRQLSKLKSTYVDALPALMDPATGRIHTTFNQTVATTGRLSSSDPNLQNIPIRSEEGRRIRAAFVAGPGHRLVSADYSQIELRVLAHLSDDAALIDAFTRDDDIHARTAADVFGALSPAEGRRLAKVINYGIVYGMGPARAARELGVSMKEADTYIRDYFGRYAGVRTYLDATIADARERGYVTTVLGRRRYLPELGARDPGVRQFAERAATNTPIQGSAADLIKLAMLAVRRRLQDAGSGAHMLLQVHDELVFEVPDAELDDVCRLVREAMEGVWTLKVPLRVDVRSGANWSEAH